MFCFLNGRGGKSTKLSWIKNLRFKANESFFTAMLFWMKNKYTPSKRPETEGRKTKFFGGKIYLGERYCVFKRFKAWSKTTKFFGGKIVLEKKSAFLNGVWFWVKNILSLLARKILCCAADLSHQNSKHVWFPAGLCSKLQIFFFFFAALHSQK